MKIVLSCYFSHNLMYNKISILVVLVSGGKTCPKINVCYQLLVSFCCYLLLNIYEFLCRDICSCIHKTVYFRKKSIRSVSFCMMQVEWKQTLNFHCEKKQTHNLATKYPNGAEEALDVCAKISFHHLNKWLHMQIYRTNKRKTTDFFFLIGFLINSDWLTRF